MNPQRNPQLALRLEGTATGQTSRWAEGAEIAYLGGHLRIALDTAGKDAHRAGDVLHLPLPPQASPRQIQDRAEAWLRSAAKRHLNETLAQKSALAGRRPPQLALSFAAQGHWAEVRDADTLRCNWRLIEQAPAVIDQVIARTLAALPREDHAPDLFSAFAT